MAKANPIWGLYAYNYETVRVTAAFSKEYDALVDKCCSRLIRHIQSRCSYSELSTRQLDLIDLRQAQRSMRQLS